MLPAGTLLWTLPEPVLVVSAGEQAQTVLGNLAAQELWPDLEGQPHWTGWLATLPPDMAAVFSMAHTTADRETPETAVPTLTLRGRTFGVRASDLGTDAGTALSLHEFRPDPLSVAVDLLDQLNLGMTVQDPQGRILGVNQAAQDILGLSLEQLTGRDSLDPRWRAIHPDGTPFPGDTHPSMHTLRTGQPQRDVPMGVFTPASAGRPSDEWRWLTITALPQPLSPWLPQGGVMTIFSDTTLLHRTRGQIHGSEQRFRSLVEATAQIVWVSAPDGMLHPPQPDWSAFTGQTDAELSGSGWMACLHPDDLEHTGQIWADALARQGLYENEYRVRRADGVYVPMVARAIPVKNEDSSVREWIGTSTDISAVRAAEARLKDLNATLEARVQERTQELAQITRFTTLLLSAAGEGILGLDSAGRNTFVNPAAARILGYSIERLIGANQHELIHHHHADGTPHGLHECAIHQTLRDGQTRRLESDVFWHAQGHAIPVAYVVTPTLDDAGEVTGAVIMFQDITERQRAREALEEAIHDLERSNAELEQFAYVASHDLQEPLRTVGSYAELLSRRYRGQLDPRADQYLNYMQAAVSRMQSLIRDLLGFAQIGRVSAPPRRVELEAVLKEARQNLRASLEASGGRVTWELPPAAADQTVMGHASLLTQLLTNLIGNSLKFQRDGVPPDVHITAHREGHLLHITILDNGIGIEPEYHERVFAIFQRLHHRETYPGNGMGLAICRKIAELHGGSLTVTSPPPQHQGSMLTLILPMAAPSS